LAPPSCVLVAAEVAGSRQMAWLLLHVQWCCAHRWRAPVATGRVTGGLQRVRNAAPSGMPVGWSSCCRAPAAACHTMQHWEAGTGVWSTRSNLDPRWFLCVVGCMVGCALSRGATVLRAQSAAINSGNTPPLPSCYMACMHAHAGLAVHSARAVCQGWGFASNCRMCAVLSPAAIVQVLEAVVCRVCTGSSSLVVHLANNTVLLGLDGVQRAWCLVLNHGSAGSCGQPCTWTCLP
jgi:hypothetical protein